MPAKVLVVCPFSSIELFLRQHYGDDLFFVSATAGMLQYEEVDYLKDVIWILESQSVNELVVVNDVSCPFINRVLQHPNNISHAVEKVLQKLYADHKALINHQPSLREKQEMLAMLNVTQQINQFIAPVLIPGLTRQNIKLNALVTDKNNFNIKTIQLKN
jgi:carbonic anhydrase